MKQSEKQREFLALYNEVHGFLSNELYGQRENDNYRSFSDCLEKIRKSNSYPSLKRYLNQLQLINRFRNLIVHNYGNEFYDIAEPTSYSMEVLSNVYNYFVKPIKISDYLSELGSPHPEILDINAQLVDVLELISKYKFSQFPVFHNNEFKGMITDNGLTNFTANEINRENGGVIYEEHTIAEIINKANIDENNKKYSILFQEQELYRVLDQFTNVKKLVNYVLITKSGKNELRDKNDLIGIFTTADIPQILNRIE